MGAWCASTEQKPKASLPPLPPHCSALSSLLNHVQKLDTQLVPLGRQCVRTFLPMPVTPSQRHEITSYPLGPGQGVEGSSRSPRQFLTTLCSSPTQKTKRLQPQPSRSTPLVQAGCTQQTNQGRSSLRVTSLCHPRSAKCWDQARKKSKTPKMDRSKIQP